MTKERYDQMLGINAFAMPQVTSRKQREDFVRKQFRKLGYATDGISKMSSKQLFAISKKYSV